MVWLKINIFKVHFWEEVCNKNEYSVYGFDNVDNYGRSLIATTYTIVLRLYDI